MNRSKLKRPGVGSRKPSEMFAGGGIAENATPLRLDRSDYLRFGLALVAGIIVTYLYTLWAVANGPKTCHNLPGGGFECTIDMKQFFLPVVVGSILSEAAAFAVLALRRGRGLAWLGFRSFPVKLAAKYILFGILVAAGVEAFLMLMANVVGGPWAQEQFPGLPLNDVKVGLTFAFLAVVAAPVFEEVVFRGIFFRVLWGRIGLVAAALVSSLVFGLVHGILPAIIGTAIIGLYLCYMYVRTGSIIPGIILHALNNLVAVVLLLAGRA